MLEKETLVIGDVHGHLDRLEGLLQQEGIIDERGKRTNNGCTVIQLGDLGHFGGNSGSPTGDRLCWEFAAEGGIDMVLWGNHDRAVISNTHHFGGYSAPSWDAREIMELLEEEGRLRFAHATHGFLVTHAGLHAQWKYQRFPVNLDRDDPVAVAAHINARKDWAVIDAIGSKRGGPSPFGGILWRDYTEKLYRGFPQVFGHSADSRNHLVRRDRDGWCIDIGGKGDSADPEGACLAGIWLPDERVVRWDHDKEIADASAP